MSISSYIYSFFRSDNNNSTNVCFEDGINDTCRNQPFGTHEKDTEEIVSEFYALIRDYIVILLFFLGLCLISYFILERFRRKGHGRRNRVLSNGRIVIREDLEEGPSMPFYVCVGGLAIVLALLVIFPLTLISNEIMRAFPENYYFRWLSTSLITSSWNHLFILSNVYIFGFVPFAYFYNEAVDLKKGFFSRIWESVFQLSLLGLLLYGFSQLIKEILGIHEIEGLFSLHFLCFGLSVTICIKSIPKGIVTLFQFSWNLGFFIFYREKLQILLAQLEFEEQTLLNKLESEQITSSSQTPTNFQRPQIKLREANFSLFSDYHQYFRDFETMLKISKRHLSNLNKEFSLEKIAQNKVELTTLLNSSIWMRNIIFMITLFTNITLFLSFVFMILFSCMKIFFTEDFGNRTFESNKSMKMSFGDVLLETALVFYVNLTSIIGIYTLPEFNKIFQKSLFRTKGMTTPEMIVNIVILLVISTSLPVITKVLGITGFSLLGAYKTYVFLRSYRFLTTSYKLLILGFSFYGLLQITKQNK